MRTGSPAIIDWAISTSLAAPVTVEARAWRSSATAVSASLARGFAGSVDDDGFGDGRERGWRGESRDRPDCLAAADSKSV
jgi:hypothetical protein